MKFEWRKNKLSSKYNNNNNNNNNDKIINLSDMIGKGLKNNTSLSDSVRSMMMMTMMICRRRREGATIYLTQRKVA